MTVVWTSRALSHVQSVAEDQAVNHFPTFRTLTTSSPRSPTGSTWLGLWIGLSIVPIVVVDPTGHFSLGLALIFAVVFSLGGAIFGYLFFLMRDPARWERFNRVWGTVTIWATICLLVAFPGYWLQAAATSGVVVLMLLGMIAPSAMLAVGAAFGINHLIRHWVVRLGPPSKPSSIPPGGVWDLDLDHGEPAWQ